MHILIDLQGAQAENRYRGIGRYALQFSLALAKLAQGQYRIALLLNTAFADTIDPLREAFADVVAPEDIHLWTPLSPCHALDPANAWRRAASEALYIAKLRQLQPDWLLITSLFEGQRDDVVCAVDHSAVTTAVILYDLIPLIHKGKYLEKQDISIWYHHQLAWLRKADLLLSISNSSAKEAMDHLDWPRKQVSTIFSAADARFRPLIIDSKERINVWTKYGIRRNFLFADGALFEPRKNVPRLIAAYARISPAVREKYQLILLQKWDNGIVRYLQQLVEQYGLKEGDVVLTGFVTDDDLIRLYNLSTLFISPSLHEGFGLPALEAMACGTPVLASNTTSLPEVVDLDEALFDPLNVDEISALIQRALSDDDFRARLKVHALQQANKFTWEKTAQRALEALQSNTLVNTKFHPAALSCFHSLRRPLLAYVSPLQSAKSGIADYSAELLPELARQYDIEVVVQQDEPLTDPWVLANARQRTVDEFLASAQRYDRVLYHIGNSPYHAHMFDLIERVPGMIVLHDFYLTGVYEWLESRGELPGIWQKSLLHSHGWEALSHRFTAKLEDVRAKWPCNLQVLQRAIGVIVHSDYSRQLAAQWYGQDFANSWMVIPLLRRSIPRGDWQAARATLGLLDDDMLVCSFGLLGASKLNHRLLDAWLASDLARDPRCRLVFVGEAGGEYGAELTQRMCAAQGRITITGWADENIYRTYLASADMAVQLRGITRGETSAAVLDCMNAGLATICNVNGSLAELPSDAVWMLDENFSDADLIKALQTLRANAERRIDLGRKAQAHIHQHHQPRACAAQYAQAIESAYAHAQQGMLGFAGTLRRLGVRRNSRVIWSWLLGALSRYFPPPIPACVNCCLIFPSSTKGMQKPVFSGLFGACCTNFCAIRLLAFASSLSIPL